MPGIPRPETVAPYRLARLAALLPATLTGADAEVTGITHDSRAVRPGDLYAALPGANRQNEALANAAVAAAAADRFLEAEGLLRAPLPFRAG